LGCWGHQESSREVVFEGEFGKREQIEIYKCVSCDFEKL
jgi:hypothetical protein